MGLLVKLKNGDTQLKSLKFGKDRPEGGDSNQPYIKSSIPLDVKNASFYNDFIIRGGIKAPLSAAEDVARLTKYFADVKNPLGLLFTAKQNLLSRVGTKTEASKGPAYANGNLNEGIYTPASTLLQAGTGFLGAHYTKQGLDPTGLFSTGQIVKYLNAINQNQFQGTTFLPQNNRLISLTNAITTKKPVANFSGVQSYNLNSNNTLISYLGGPDSEVGVGGTIIHYSTDNFGVPIKTLENKATNDNNSWGKKPYYPEDVSKWVKPIKSSIQYSSFDPNSLEIINKSLYLTTSSWADTTISSSLSLNNKITIFSNSNSWIVPTGSTLLYNSTLQKEVINNANQKLFKSYISSSQTLREQGSYQLQSFPLNKNGSGASTLKEGNEIKEFDDNNLVYDENNSISIKLKKQGYRNLESFTSNTGEIKVTNRNTGNALNKKYFGKTPSEEAKKEYSSKAQDLRQKLQAKLSSYKKQEHSVDTTDTVDFEIKILNPSTTQANFTDTSTIKFKSYIDSLSDSYNADWTQQVYMGRAEKFWKYNTFSRDMNISFTVASENHSELTENYKKLNELAASLAPTYTNSGYMAGNLHIITIGRYIYQQYGIITNFTYDISDDSPWDVRGYKTVIDGDQVKNVEYPEQTPKYISVTGLKFIPIHNFRPESWFNAKHKYIHQIPELSYLYP